MSSAGRQAPNARGWLDDARGVTVTELRCAAGIGMTIDLLVVHAISLPPGEFGGPYVEQLFTNRLDSQRP